MSMPCREIQLELGAYVLGSLGPADSAAIDEHVAQCSECAAEVARLGVAGEALALADLDMVVNPPEPSPAVLPNLLRRVSAARRRRRVAGSLAAAAAAAAIVVAGVVAFGGADDDVPVADPPTEAVSAQDGTLVVDVEMWDRDWGTALTVDVSGAPAGYRCSLVAVGAEGERETAATWVVPPAGYDGAGLSMDGAHALRSWEVDHYEVVTSDGELLLTLPLSP